MCRLFDQFENDIQNNCTQSVGDDAIPIFVKKMKKYMIALKTWNNVKFGYTMVELGRYSKEVEICRLYFLGKNNYHARSKS